MPIRKNTVSKKLASSPTPATDAVNPSHYKPEGGVECIDLIKQNLTHEQFVGYLAGNHQKYVFRWQSKGGAVDLQKAQWYLNRLLEEVKA